MNPTLGLELQDNSFTAAGVATIHVKGEGWDDADWQVMGSASRYSLDAAVAVGSGKTLTVGSGVEIWTGTSYGNGYDLTVHGTMTADGVSFTGSTQLTVRATGMLDLLSSTLDGDWVHYYEGSRAKGLYTRFNVPVEIGAMFPMDFHHCDFAASSVTVSGNPTATVDMSFNWWGTTDPAEIENKILHRVDDAGRPLVEFDPPLPHPPSEDLFYVMEMWPAEEITWRTYHIDLMFNRDIDLSTLDPEDISLTRDGESFDVVYMSKVDDATYRIVFDELLSAGTYSLTLAPTVLDTLGNQMDQDFDGVQGEDTEDAFAHDFVIRLSPPGDLNGDGQVGSADLDIVRSHWGETVPAGDLLSGDPSGDGTVGSADLDIIRGNWGAGTPVAAGVDDTAPVYGPRRSSSQTEAHDAALSELADNTRFTRWAQAAWEYELARLHRR